jgi:hypothetical protein
MPLTSFTYKMNAKLKEEGFQRPLCFMPCWHIDEEKHQPVIVNTQRPLWLEVEICLLGINRDKSHP